ncbi:MAG: deoxyribose-phosphate aldolase [Tamlana sp.]
MNTSKYIDFALLSPIATEQEVIDHCFKARNNDYYAVNVNSAFVPLAKQLLEDTDVKVSTVVGFPLGATSTKAKSFEAKNAIEEGADEIDMVINLGYLKSRNYVAVFRDISDVKMAIGNTPLKVIIEISELNKNEIVKACEICLDAKADYIKTSTGFSKNGATLTAVKIIKKIVKNKVKIEASGGIDDCYTLLKYIEAGADRVSSSSETEITNKNPIARNSKIYKKYIDSLEKKEAKITSNINSLN